MSVKGKTDPRGVVERRVATPDPNLVVVRIGEKPRRVVETAVGAEEGRVRAVVATLVRVAKKPGTSRAGVYRSSLGRAVYAYFVDSGAPGRMVREDESGNRVTGRLVGGRFRVDPGGDGD